MKCTFMKRRELLEFFTYLPLSLRYKLLLLQKWKLDTLYFFQKWTAAYVSILDNLFTFFSCLFTIFHIIYRLSNAFWLYQHTVKYALFLATAFHFCNFFQIEHPEGTPCTLALNKSKNDQNSLNSS